MKTISCERCGAKTEAVKKSRRFCSNLCAKNAAYIKRKDVDGEERECSTPACANRVWCYPRQIKAGTRRFCSRQCCGKALLKQPPLNCTICGKQYTRSPSQEKWRGKSKFCSVKCRGIGQSESQKGPANRWWRGGISPEHRRIRYSARMQRWRMAVFERDDYTCQICGVRGSYLEADHIKQFAYYPELRFELSNGRTLCRPCHRSTETWGRRLEGKYAKA